MGTKKTKNFYLQNNIQLNEFYITCKIIAIIVKNVYNVIFP